MKLLNKILIGALMIPMISSCGTSQKSKQATVTECFFAVEKLFGQTQLELAENRGMVNINKTYSDAMNNISIYTEQFDNSIQLTGSDIEKIKEKYYYSDDGLYEAIVTFNSSDCMAIHKQPAYQNY